MGPEIGPAFQRRSRDTSFFLLGVRLAETVEVSHSAMFTFSSRAEQSSTGFPSFAPRCEPPRARAPGAQMIRMASRSSLAFPTIVSGHLGVANPQESGTDFVTDRQGVPDDVRGLPGWWGGGYVASHTLVEEQHHTIAGAMMWSTHPFLTLGPQPCSDAARVGGGAAGAHGDAGPKRWQSPICGGVMSPLLTGPT
eukprot:gene13915-biopygen6549